MIPSMDVCGGISTEIERKTASASALFQFRHAGKRDPGKSESSALLAANFVEG